MMTNEEAIRILSTRDAHGVLCGYTSGVTEALDMAIEALSVDFERIGRWYIGIDGMMHCSNCDKIPISKVQYYGAVIYDMTSVGRMMHYCPNCGARMKGVDDE